MKTIAYKGHNIQIQEMSLTGVEKVLYDGKQVSFKRTMTGGTHIFTVKEDGEDVVYEVEIGLRWHGFTSWSVVRRNGVVIYSDR